jgi:hypothetical protein
MPEIPDTIGPGVSRYGWQLDVVNNLLLDTPAPGATVVEDAEVQRALPHWRHGIGGRSEAAIYLPIQWRNGGFTDELIRLWHRLFGMPNPAVPSYRSLIRARDPSGRALVDVGSAFGPGDLSLTWKHEVVPRTSRANLAIRAGLKLPTGNPGMLLGSGAADAGVSLDSRYNVGCDIILYANLGQVWMGKATRLPSARRNMGQYLFALEYRPNSRDSFLWRADGNSLPVRTGSRFADGGQSTLTFGYKRVLDRHLMMYASFSENGDYHDYSASILGNVGPDFTATLGFEWNP